MRRDLWIGAALLTAVIVAVTLLPVSTIVVQLSSWARDAGWRGVVLFFVAYVAATVMVLPGAILTLAAGFAYGPLWGLAVASPASVLAATCAFLLGRTRLRGWVSRRIGTSPRGRALDAAMEREGFRLVLLLRLSPLFPFSVLNYLLSLSKVSLGTYVVASAIGMLPGTALYVYLGSLAPAAAEVAATGTGRSSAAVVLYAVGLVATVAAVVIATRTARKALDAQVDMGGQ